MTDKIYIKSFVIFDLTPPSSCHLLAYSPPPPPVMTSFMNGPLVQLRLICFSLDDSKSITDKDIWSCFAEQSLLLFSFEILCNFLNPSQLLHIAMI